MTGPILKELFLDIRKLQRAIVDGLEDVKAQNIVVFNTEAMSPLFERVIIASGHSNRQTKALASSVRETVKKRGLAVLRTEGEENGEWIIVDCGAAVAHIMQPAIRDYYHLEEIWGAKPVRLKGQSTHAAPTLLPKASEDASEGVRKDAGEGSSKRASAGASERANERASSGRGKSGGRVPSKATPGARSRAPAKASSTAPAKAPARAPSAKKAAAKSQPRKAATAKKAPVPRRAAPAAVPAAPARKPAAARGAAKKAPVARAGARKAVPRTR